MIFLKIIQNTLKIQSGVGNLGKAKSWMTIQNKLFLAGRSQLAVRITTIEMSKTKIKIDDRAIMVGTFLSEGRYGLQKINITATKIGPEKVYATVTTFLKEDGNDCRKSGL